MRCFRLQFSVPNDVVCRFQHCLTRLKVALKGKHINTQTTHAAQLYRLANPRPDTQLFNPLRRCSVAQVQNKHRRECRHQMGKTIYRFQRLQRLLRIAVRQAVNVMCDCNLTFTLHRYWKRLASLLHGAAQGGEDSGEERHIAQRVHQHTQ